MTDFFNMTIVFIGHFSPLSKILDTASSSAGNQVQRQIINELASKYGTDKVLSYSMTPLSAWPHDTAIYKKHQEDSILFLGYLNVPILKHVVFSLRLFVKLIMVRPQICLQYNSYFFENLVLLLYRFCNSDCSLAIVIQDILVTPETSLLRKSGIRSLSERASLLLAQYFDLIVPISSAIINDFHLNPDKCFIFQGGITYFSEKIMNNSELHSLLDLGVFAGALEPYNGIDKLVDQWIAFGIQWPLHIFGKGSLENHIKQAAESTEKIIFHGFQPEHVILEWQSKARWNFCLRYSLGLNQKYFFPSKFFNIVCASGAILVNDFYGLPDPLRKYLNIVSDNLSDLQEQLVLIDHLPHQENIRARREAVKKEYNWKVCIEKIINILTNIKS